VHTIKIKNLIRDYEKIRSNIEKRMLDFENLWNRGDDDEMFCELVFCLFTPQSKAKNCWKTVNILKDKNLLYSGTSEALSEYMNMVRFRNNKAKYLVLARELFIQDKTPNIKNKISTLLKSGDARDWLVDNVKGLGFKEAGHFLRNIGGNFNYAILDRHILKNLKDMEVIDSIPKTISKRLYIEFENKMQKFAQHINIPIGHLDLLLWYKQAGEIFK